MKFTRPLPATAPKALTYADVILQSTLRKDRLPAFKPF